MKLFIDSANLEEIEKALAEGMVTGVTTNPSLLAKEPKANYLEHLKKIVALLLRYDWDASLSVEVFSDDPNEMVRQANQFVGELNYPHLAVKIPISYNGRVYLGVVRHLARVGISVNCTACMTPMQLAMGAESGARFVSIFYNRVRDGETEPQYAEARTKALADKSIEQTDFNPNTVLKEASWFLTKYPKTEIIAGSIRSVLDVKQAGLAGAHIVTASYKVVKAATQHFKTDHAVGQFMSDFKTWMS